MDDIFDMNQNAGEQQAEQTRVMQPVEAEPAQPVRHRRTERNRANYEETEAMAEKAEEQPAAEAPAAEAPAAAQPQAGTQKVVPPTVGGTTPVPRFQTRYNPPVSGSVPSQGVPQPSALSGQTPRRPVLTPSTGTVRRPVDAEGYTPVKPLGISRPAGQEAPERSFARPEFTQTRRPQQVPVLDDEDEYEETEDERKGGMVLPIVIIALLVVAALVLGLLMIPEDMAGPLGDVKRAVSGLFGGGQSEQVAAQAHGFTGVVSRDTAPYSVSFSVTTSTGAKDVRVLDGSGEVLETVTRMTTPNTDKTIWMLEMTLETEYEGTVHLQINDGESWLDTGLLLQLSIGTDMKLKISDVPSTTLTAVFTAAATANATLTADSTTEPTVSPAMEEISSTDAAGEPERTDGEPEATVEGEAAQETPDAFAATPTPAVTPTPTMALTPTPTVNVTDEPTPAPTDEPTPEPTEEPTAEPTATPTPSPAPTPRLEAAAAESADPALISTQKIYKDNRLVESYQRDEESLINMPAGDEYLTIPFGVTTFRGNAFRTNAAVGTVTEPTAMSVLWTVEGGSLEAKSRTFYGFGVYAQPAIVKWPKDVRQTMALNEGYVDKSALKEVIIAGQDGKIYFLDLTDGTATREAIDLGYAMRSTPSIYPLSYPLMTVGQYSNKLPSKTGKTMGLYYYSLMDNEQVRLIDGLDGSNDRQYYNVGAFDTSALFDRNSTTLISVGTNGLLYTEKLDMYFAVNDGGMFKFNGVEEQAVLMSHTKKQDTAEAAVESSLAMYGSYAFYADMGGVLRCVDTTTMTTMWAVDTGDAVRAAVALDLDEETNTLWLYTANTITNRSAKNNDVTIRRFNAMTGEEDWQLAVNCVRKSGKKDSYSKDVTAGAVASPVIGQNQLGEMVYFTLSSLSANGNEKVTGKSEAQAAVLMAMKKETGEIVWTLPMDAYCYSSPVAVYSEDGRGWIVQGCSNGTLYLLDGLTGEVINTLQVEGVIEGSPAVYNDTVVFGTTGKGKSFVYAVKLQ